MGSGLGVLNGVLMKDIDRVRGLERICHDYVSVKVSEYQSVLERSEL